MPPIFRLNPVSTADIGASRRAIRIGVFVAAGLVLGSGLTACTTASATGESGGEAGADITVSAVFTEQRLDWKGCSAPSVPQGGGSAPKPLEDGSKWECADMKAPLDWTKQDGKKIDIALIRVKAKDTKHRIGSLVFNFGGPGGSGVTTLPNLTPDSYMKLHSRYDLVSFDPRGVGASEGVVCLSDKANDAGRQIDSTPNTPAEVEQLTALGKKTSEGCEKKSGAVLAHVDTPSAARDMDLMRQILGDKKLNYFGISYGTLLGGVYAHLFPEHVGRAVSDAVVDPTVDPSELATSQAKGFELALGNFLEACAAAGKECPTGTDPKKGADRVAALLKKLDEQPLPTQQGRKVNESTALGGISQALYSHSQWPALIAGLQEAMSGQSANTLLALADAQAGRNQQGRYSNSNPALNAITCVDKKQRYTLDDAQAKVRELREVAPIFGESGGWGMLGCTGWPVPGETDKPEVSAPGSAPILVIGNTGDPATPVEGAKRMADALGKGVGINITNEGEGHGSYGHSKCVTKTVDAYLLKDKVPSDGLVCTS
jgi:pimeloyl-ACP methyl ester carboxylesterase